MFYATDFFGARPCPPTTRRLSRRPPRPSAPTTHTVLCLPRSSPNGRVVPVDHGHWPLPLSGGHRRRGVPADRRRGLMQDPSRMERQRRVLHHAVRGRARHKVDQPPWPWCPLNLVLGVAALDPDRPPEGSRIRRQVVLAVRRRVAATGDREDPRRARCRTPCRAVHPRSTWAAESSGCLGAFAAGAAACSGWRIRRPFRPEK